MEQSNSDIEEINAAIRSGVEVDEDVDVIIKSEFHSSSGDLEEELELLQTDAFDAVVFEGASEKVEQINSATLGDRFLDVIFLILSPLYTNTKPLLAAVSQNDTTPFYTRERDSDILEGVPQPYPTLIYSMLGFFLFFTGFFGIPEGTIWSFHGQELTYKYLSLFSFAGLFGLPIVVREVRNRFGESTNRNQVMAQKIEEASEEGRTLAILGKKHSGPVEKRLPDELETQVLPYLYSLWSVRGIKESIPGFIGFLALFFGIWAVVEFIASLGIAVLLMLILG